MNILSIIVLAYWLRVYILETRRLPRLIDEDAGPSTRVSIIIPVRNEESRIGKCLDSVLRQRGVVSQVIVVDDSSVDDTRKVV
ncbi:MAG: glycosyltransferase, partial [Nitrososphaerota archaeon]